MVTMTSSQDFARIVMKKNAAMHLIHSVVSLVLAGEHTPNVGTQLSAGFT